MSKSEVKAAYFKFFGYTIAEDELTDIFERVDPAGTGYIGYDEFVVASLNEKGLLHQDKLRKAVSQENAAIHLLHAVFLFASPV